MAKTVGYTQVLEKQLAKGKSLTKAHKIAGSPLMRKKDVFDKPSWLDKAILKRLRRKKKKREGKEKDKGSLQTYEDWLKK